MESGETVVADRSAISAARSRPPQRWLVATLGIVTLAAIAIAVWQFAGGRAAKQAAGTAASRQNMEIVRLTATGSSREATISPDGRYVAYITDDAGLAALWVTQVATGSRVQILPPEDIQIWDPVFSPDGDFIYYCRMNNGEPPPDLYRVATLGGPTRKVMDDVTGRVSFSPDGQRFVFFRGSPTQSKLVVSNVDGTDEKVVATVEAPKNYDDPTWSPDGKIIAASLQTFDKGPETHVIGVSPDGGDERQLSEETWFDIGEIAWLPDGSGVIINGQSLDSVQLWEVMVPSGETRRVTNDLNSYHGVGMTADGTTLVTQLVEDIFHMWNLAPDGSDPVRITTNVSGNDGNGLAWTPNGRLVYDTVSGGNLEIWSVNADGTDARQLIANDALNAGPVVSADGKYLVYMSTLSTTVNVWRANPDGSNPVQLTHGSLDVEPRLSPDGAWVLYVDAQTGSLYRIPIEGGEATLVREKRGNTGEVSPDGRLIMASALDADSRRMILEIFPFDGGEPLYTFDLGEEMENPHWSPDGRFVTYVHAENDVENLWRIPMEGGEPEQRTHFDADHIREFAWSPDGTRMVVSRGRVNNDIVLLKNFR
jgi:Tol biopolymer transport system component